MSYAQMAARVVLCEKYDDPDTSIMHYMMQVPVYERAAVVWLVRAFGCLSESALVILAQ